jgi:DNA polymerase I
MLGSGQNPGPFFVLEPVPVADIDCLGKSRKNSYTQPSSSNQVTGRKKILYRWEAVTLFVESPGMQQEIYLVDGSAYIYRAYHAIAPLSNSHGLPTNAVLGFVNMINRLLREKNPHFLAVAFDSRGPVFRHALYDRYKANRPPMPEDLSPQLPYIKKFVQAAQICLLEQQGVEADDILATAVNNFTALGHRIVLVSGDKDLLQLVGDSVQMWDPMQDKVMDHQAVLSKYGVPPERLLDLFALIGDSADNIPGVPGIGLKTAAKLIGEYGNLENLYAAIGPDQKAKTMQRLVESRDLAFLSRELIQLKTDVEIPRSLESYSCRPADPDLLGDLYRELEFSNLLKGLESSKPVPDSGFCTVTSRLELGEVVAALRAAEIMVFDTETTSLNARHAELVGVSLCTDLSRAWYIPFGHRDSTGQLVAGQLPEKEVLAALRPLFLSPTLTKVGHNLKYDLTVLQQQWDIEPRGQLVDTMIAAYLAENGGRSLGLDALCRERGMRLISFTELVGNDTADGCFARVAPDAAGRYSCEDVYATLFLWQEFAPKLAAKWLEELFYQVEMPIVAILAEMESAGICIDTGVLAGLKKEFSANLATLEKEIFAVAGHSFNIQSPRQLGQVLFEELGLPHGRKTKTGYSTDVKVLERLAGKHHLPALILRYRSFAKLLSTYVERLAEQQDPATGRIHTSYNQAVTATGRLSSSDPNLQNIPIRTEEGGRIRAAFVPGQGLVFLAADYSQIDLRVLAHYSRDPALVAAFQGDEDIHARTAAEIFGVSPLLVTSEMRRVAKSINFGIVYGMSSFGLASQLDISRSEAQRFIDRYFRLYSGVQQFMADIVRQARADGYVTTLLNRRRTVTEIDAKNRVQREFAERMAINTPIQGTAADIIKLAMIACHRVIGEQQLAAKMLLQIHDELVFELPEAEVEKTTALIRPAMEEVIRLMVPLRVNFTVGRNLAK